MSEDLKMVIRYAASPYAIRARTQAAEAICGQKALFIPNDMLYAIRKRYGFHMFILTELIFFGWCFLLLAVIDNLLIQPVWHFISGLIVCSAAFCFDGDEIHRAMWKITILLILPLWCRYWSLIGLTLLLFVHIPSHSSIRERL